jgi:hypothetical protein
MTNKQALVGVVRYEKGQGCSTTSSSRGSSMSTDQSPDRHLDSSLVESSFPCPWWCERDRGHGWDSEDGSARNKGRFHVIHGAHAIIGGVDNGTPQADEPRDVSIDLSVYEHVWGTGDSAARSTSRPVLTMSNVDGIEFDPWSARQLAAALLNAADRLEEITGATI